MFFSKVNVENYTNFAKINISYFNDGVHDTIVNFTVKSNVTVYGCIIYIVLRRPESPSDTLFRHESFRVAIDFEKFLKGARGNSFPSRISNFLVNQATKLVDFDLKLPFEKVSIIEACFVYFKPLKTYFFQGNCTITNITFPGSMIPRSTPFISELIGSLKIKDQQIKKLKMVKFMKVVVYGKLNI